MSFSVSKPFNASKSDALIGGIALSLFLLALITYLYIEQHQAQENWQNYYAVLPESYGITTDTPIKLSGIVIGKITSLTLTPKTQIKVDIKLNKDYRHFYTNTATLSIDGDIGLTNVISGNSLIFTTEVGGDLLPENAQIKFVEPASITDWIEELKLSDSLTAMNQVMVNINTVLESVHERQEKFDEILKYTANATDNIAQNSLKLNEVLTKSLTLLDNSNKLIAASEQDVKQNLKALNGVLIESRSVLQSSNALLTNMNNVSKSAPQVLDSANNTLLEIDMLTKQLREHWLLGGEKTTTDTKHQPNVVYPTDWSIYQDKEKSKSN